MTIRVTLCVVIAVSLLAGCADIPIKNGGLVIAKDTTVGIEDIGAARVTQGF
jgi:hypothetical protein